MKKKQVVYLDMDNVVVDFTQGYKDAFNRDARLDDSFTVEQFCLQIPHFFRMLPVNVNGFLLFQELNERYDVKFLTSPMKSMIHCKRDKILWIKENIGSGHDVLFSDKKSSYVQDNTSILIDDFDKNIKEWNSRGGTGIDFTKYSNKKIIEKIENVFDPKEEIKLKDKLKNMVVETDLSESQKSSGIYKKGKISFKGLDLRIENLKGSYRSGFNDRGQRWIVKMKNHYGYITGTEGADFDPLDCFIGDKLNASRVFVVNQQTSDGLFDEHKIMLGYDDLESAKKGYMSNYQKNWDGLMSIKQTNTKKLREWLQEGNTKDPF